MVDTDILEGLKNGAIAGLGGALVPVSGPLGPAAAGYAAERFLDIDGATVAGVAVGTGMLLASPNSRNGRSGGRRRV